MRSATKAGSHGYLCSGLVRETGRADDRRPVRDAPAEDPRPIVSQDHVDVAGPAGRGVGGDALERTGDHVPLIRAVGARVDRLDGASAVDERAANVVERPARAPRRHRERATGDVGRLRPEPVMLDVGVPDGRVARVAGAGACEEADGRREGVLVASHSEGRLTRDGTDTVTCFPCSVIARSRLGTNWAPG